MRKEHETRVLFVCLLVLCGVGVLGKNVALSTGNVAVDFYSESLCPYCANFVVNYLSKIFQNGIIDIVDLRIIPFGNAQIYDDGEMVCQHGEDECKLNLIQTCAMAIWPNVTQSFPFILCLEQLVIDLGQSEVFDHWKTCVDASGLKLEPIQKCLDGPVGDKLEWESAEETANLDPPKEYVPWVIVDGTPLYDGYVNVEEAICLAYAGAKPKPERCEIYTDAVQVGDGEDKSHREDGREHGSHGRDEAKMTMFEAVPVLDQLLHAY